MSTEFWIQMLVYAVSIGSFAGVVLSRLSSLEKKQTSTISWSNGWPLLSNPAYLTVTE